MHYPNLPKPSTAFTKDQYSPSLSSRASSTDKLSSLPDNLLPSTAASSQSSQASITATTNQYQQEINLKIQLLSPHYKSLSLHYSKFLNKSSLTAKANHLRLTLLKFLRSDIQFQLPINLKIYVPQHVFAKFNQFTGTGIRYFIRYWVTILIDAFKNWSSLSHVDRTCYLECISRLMSRKEWLNSPGHTQIYQELLIFTINFIFRVLFNLKTLSLGINAFIGKVFAYGYMVVPNLSKLLLFTLFVKNRAIYKIIASLQPQVKIVKESNYPEHLASLIGFQGDFKVGEEMDPRLLNINCMKPPQVTTTFYTEELNEFFDDEFEDLQKYDVLSINLKDAAWVKKWASFDSDIFKSFLKHYLEFSLFYQNSDYQIEIDDPNDSLVSFINQQPGGIIIYTHLFEIVNSNFNMLKNFKMCQFKETFNSRMKNEIAAFYASVKSSNSGKNYQTYLSQTSFLKLLKVLQTIIYTSSDTNGFNHAENEVIITKYFENILLLKAKRISPHNPESCEILYDLLLQLCLHLSNPKSGRTFSLQDSLSLKSSNFSQAIDWKFWILGLTRMLSTENMISQAKALTSLFNIWDVIPVDYELDHNKSIVNGHDGLGNDADWILDARYSLIHNLSVYLVSDSSWKRLFIHWQPLIRHFYIRLVLFKIVQRKASRNLSIIVRKKLEETYKLFMENYENSKYDDKLLRFELQPSMPIFNKKLIITYFKIEPTSKNHSLIKSKSYVDVLELKSKQQELKSSSPSSTFSNFSTTTMMIPSTNKTVYAFDIFDDAIYSSSSYSSHQTSAVSLQMTSSSASLPKSYSKSSLKSLTASLKSARTVSTSSLPSPQRSPSISRSSSSSGLSKVPIIVSALSFFKKNTSTPRTQEPPTVPESGNSLEVTPPQCFGDRFLNTPTITTNGPTPRSSPSYKSPFYSDNGYSPSSSSISEVSDEDRPTQLIISKRSDSDKLTSRVSSSASVSSLSTTIAATAQNGNSMDSIPYPPELMVKIPKLKDFKYKYQMVMTHDSFQQLLFARHLSDTDKKFFNVDEVLKLDDVIPKKPRLPFEKNSLKTSSSLGLFSTASDSEEDDDDDDDDDDRLGINRPRLPQWLEKPHSPSQSVVISKIVSNKPFRVNSKLYEGITSWQILGKVLNEWDAVVEEFEKYSELVKEEMNDDLDGFTQDQWFWSPMLVCDIPPSKTLFQD